MRVNNLKQLHKSHLLLIQFFSDFYKGIIRENGSYTPHCCSGPLIELLQTLSVELDFDFNLYLSPDGSHGRKDPTTGNWTGMIKELIEGKQHQC